MGVEGQDFGGKLFNTRGKKALKSESKFYLLSLFSKLILIAL